MHEERPPSIIERFADTVGINRWFLRRRPVRIDAPANIIVSPCDSTVDFTAPIDLDGTVNEKTIFGRQRTIRVPELVKGVSLPDIFHGGMYVKQYLSPFRLHYLLFPAGGKVVGRRRVAGSCLPICVVRSADVKNERMVFTIDTEFGFPMITVLIGSWMVSGIRSEVEVGKTYRRGDDLGRFKIGSTVINLFPKNTVRLLVEPGSRAQLGTPIAEVE